MIPDPATAAPRTDLPFLTRRSRRRSTTAPSAATGSAVIDYRHHTRSSQTTDDLLDLSAPAAAGPTDTPADTTPPMSAPAPAPAPPTPIVDDDLLNLSTPAAGPTLTPQRPASPSDAAPAAHPVRRLRGDDRELLTASAPTLTLTRVQSGVGGLSIVLQAPPGSDLSLAMILTDTDGESSVLDPTAGATVAGPIDVDPIVSCSASGFGSFTVNLRRARELQRWIVVAFSAAGRAIDWSGTLTVSTYGGGRVDMPIDTIAASPCAIVASLYNVRGEFVLRAEGQPMTGGLREAARSFGFDTISWLDGRTPAR